MPIRFVVQSNGLAQRCQSPARCVTPVDCLNQRSKGILPTSARTNRSARRTVSKGCEKERAFFHEPYDTAVVGVALRRQGPQLSGSVVGRAKLGRRFDPQRADGSRGGACFGYSTPPLRCSASYRRFSVRCPAFLDRARSGTAGLMKPAPPTTGCGRCIVWRGAACQREF